MDQTKTYKYYQILQPTIMQKYSNVALHIFYSKIYSKLEDHQGEYLCLGLWCLRLSVLQSRYSCGRMDLPTCLKSNKSYIARYIQTFGTPNLSHWFASFKPPGSVVLVGPQVDEISGIPRIKIHIWRYVLKRNVTQYPNLAKIRAQTSSVCTTDSQE